MDIVLGVLGFISGIIMWLAYFLMHSETPNLSAAERLFGGIKMLQKENLTEKGLKYRKLFFVSGILFLLFLLSGIFFYGQDHPEIYESFRPY